MERSYLKLWKQYLTEEVVSVNQDQLDTLQSTTSEDGVRGMIKQGVCTYTDEAGNEVTVDLTAVPGARGISMSGNINVDSNSVLFGYLSDYVLTLTKTPERSGLVNPNATIEKLINNSNSKFIQFVNPAADDETMMFIRLKSGKVEMLYLNVTERK